MKNSSGRLSSSISSRVSSYWHQTHIYVGMLTLVRLSGWEEIKMKCMEGVNEMSGLGGGEEG